MKKLITLSLLILLASCSNETLTPQEQYKDMYRVGANEHDNVSFELNTNYKEFTTTIYDLNGKEPILIYQSNKPFSTTLNLKFKGKYEFTFTPTNQTENPKTNIFIYNKTTDNVIENYERNGCLLGYKFTLIVK